MLVLLPTAARAGVVSSSFAHKGVLLARERLLIIGRRVREYSNIEWLIMEITLAGPCHESEAGARLPAVARALILRKSSRLASFHEKG